VAIKEIDKKHFDYKKELRLVRRLNHDNVIKYFGWFYNEDSVFLVMEYFPSDLSQLIEKKKGAVTKVWNQG